MKKIIYIAIAVFALGMVSCSKQDIQPNSPSDVQVPVWKSNSSDVTDPQLGGTGTGTITDPQLGGTGGDNILSEN